MWLRRSFILIPALLAGSFLIVAGIPSAETKKQPTLLTNSIGMKLARVEAGEFMMGNQETARAVAAAFNEKEESFYSEMPLHRVKITQPFYLGCCEVSVGQFGQFVQATGYKTDAEKQLAKATSLDPNKGAFNDAGSAAGNWKTQSQAIAAKERARHPVVMVSWNDAQAFCKWLSDKEGRTYRLPSEAEWEYACRAGTTTRYWNGDDPEDLVKIANVPDRSFLEDYQRRNQKPLGYRTIKGDDGYAGTAPVGSFQANPWGLYDMHGNVWEWCNDWYSAEYYKKARLADPRGLAEGEERVIRGGCYM
jgi:sulfatase modifying factor 1